MTLDIDELESKAKAATPGEWQHEDGGYVGQYIDGRFEYSLVAYCGGPDRENMHEGPANAAYIAAANPETMLALIARIRELEADNKDFLDQISAQTESVLYKELQEALARNNALFAENEALKAQLKQEQEDGSEMLMIAYLDGASKARALADKRRAENEALRVKQAGLLDLVKKAYHEGFGEGIKEHTTHRGGKGWHESRARAMLSGSPLKGET